MSWQAYEWAIRQTTGSTGRKSLLLALGYYADKDGYCWPAQATLAKDTEQSVDTVQRQLLWFERQKFLARELMPRRRGEWPAYSYRLSMKTNPTSASENPAAGVAVRLGQAAACTPAMPQSLRRKPLIEPTSEPLRKTLAVGVVERQRAFQRKQEGIEVVQNRIAQRIGSDGWLVLGALNDTQRSRLSQLERQGRLDDETLANAILTASLPPRRSK